MKIEWESYFLGREIERAKEKRRRRRRRIVQFSLVFFIFCLAAGMASVREMQYQQTEYGKIERDAKNQDFRLVAVRMAEALNEKYGEGTCEAEDLMVSRLNQTVGSQYLAFRGNFPDASWKEVCLIYLSEEEFICVDNLQWREIAAQLEEEAARRTGYEKVCVDLAEKSEMELSESYYYCPWLTAGGYLTKFEGDLEDFFAQEQRVRASLPGAEKLDQSLQINGTFAFYFGKPSVQNLDERMKNPQIAGADQYQSGLSSLEEQYQIDIFSAVLAQDYFENLEKQIRQGAVHGVFPTTHKDYGPGQTFYNPVYTVMSYAYGQVFLPKAEQAAEGIYVFSVDEREWLDTYGYQEYPAKEELVEAVERTQEGWKIQDTFAFQREDEHEEYDLNRCTVAVDIQELYPGKEVSLAGETYSGPEILGEEESCPASIYSNDYYSRWDGYLIVNGMEGSSGSVEYTLLTR